MELMACHHLFNFSFSRYRSAEKKKAWKVFKCVVKWTRQVHYGTEVTFNNAFYHSKTLFTILSTVSRVISTIISMAHGTRNY